MPKGNLGFFTIDPATGKVTANFKGHIQAQGLDLLAGTGTVPPDDRRIIWHEIDFTGRHVMELFSADVGTTSQGYLVVNNPSGINAGITAIQHDAEGNINTRVLATADGGGAAPSNAVIIGAGQVSNFLQLTGVAKRKIAFGSASMNFPTSTNSDATVVAHGLGIQPAIVICMALQAPNYNQIPVYSLFSSDVTNFTVIGFIPVARTGGISFYWLAIG